MKEVEVRLTRLNMEQPLERRSPGCQGVGSPSLHFCAEGLDQGQAKGGSDAVHPFSHCSSLRGNHWCDGSRLWHCAVDAEQPVTSIAFGRLLKMDGFALL